MESKGEEQNNTIIDNNNNNEKEKTEKQQQQRKNINKLEENGMKSSSPKNRERKLSLDEDPDSWEGKPMWRHDRDAKQCFGCKSNFTLILRKHHCRGCGEVFCNSCTKFRTKIYEHYKNKPVRTCQLCASPKLLKVSAVPSLGGEVILIAKNVGLKGDVTSPTIADEISIFVDDEECTGVRIMGESDSKNRNSWAPSEAKLARGATKIRFSMEPGVGRNKTLRLRNSSGLEGETKISYDKPIIQHCTRAPTKGGRIVITGLNFGTNVSFIKHIIGKNRSSLQLNDKNGKGSNDSNNNNISDLKDENTNDRSNNRIKMIRDHSVIECFIPPGSGTDIPLNLNVCGQIGRGNFSYESPEISDATEVASGGGDLVLTGNNFGSDSRKITITIIYDDWNVHQRKQSMLKNWSSTKNTTTTDDGRNNNNNNNNNSNNQQREIDVKKSKNEDLHTVTATGIQILTAHSKLKCRVPAYPSRSGRSSPMVNVRRARAILSVDGQTSSPVIFTYKAPQPPSPIPSPSVQTPRRRLSFFGGNNNNNNNNNNGNEDGNNNNNDVPNGNGANNATTTTNNGSILEFMKNNRRHARSISSSSNRSSINNRRQSSRRNSRAINEPVFLQQTQKPPPSRLVQNDMQEARSAAVFAFFGDARLEEARLATVPQNWIPDDEASACMLCEKDFTFFVRKHHCRHCGAIVCNTCSSQRTVIGQFTIPVRLCDECYDLAQMRNKMQTYVYEVRRLMALLPPDEGATFRQEITIALDEGARYRAEQTVMLEEARANARRAADSWSRRSTFSGNLPSQAGMHMVTPPSERRRRVSQATYNNDTTNNHDDNDDDHRYERVTFGSNSSSRNSSIRRRNNNYNRRSTRNNRGTATSIDSISLDSNGITLDVSTMSPAKINNNTNDLNANNDYSEF